MTWDQGQWILVFAFAFNSPLVPITFLKMIFFSHRIALTLLPIIIWIESISGLYSVPLSYLSFFIPIPHCLYYYRVLEGLKIRYCLSSIFGNWSFWSLLFSLRIKGSKLLIYGYLGIYGNLLTMLPCTLWITIYSHYSWGGYRLSPVLCDFYWLSPLLFWDRSSLTCLYWSVLSSTRKRNYLPMSGALFFPFCVGTFLVLCLTTLGAIDSQHSTSISLAQDGFLVTPEFSICVLQLVYSPYWQC